MRDMIEKKKGVAGKGGHFEEYCRCIDKIYELLEFLPV